MKHKIKALEELIQFATDMEKTKYTNRKKRKKPEPKEKDEREDEEIEE